MDLQLFFTIAIVIIAFIVILVTLLVDTYVKTNSERLKIEKKILNTKYNFEVAKNYELYETLEFIKNTKKIPKKVLDNSYEFMIVEDYLKDNNIKIDDLKSKFKENLNFKNEEISKEKINEYIKSQNKNKNNNYEK